MKFPDPCQLIPPSMVYSYVPPPPVGDVIVIVPSFPPKQVTFVELTVALSTAGSVIVIGPWFAVHVFASVTTRL